MSHRIVFFDTHVEPYRALGGTLPPDIEQVVLDPGIDGLEQIGMHLLGRQGLEAVHVVSHGSPGARASGQTVVGAGSFDRQAPWLHQNADAVAPRGGRPQRGCKLASNGAGRSNTETRD